MFARHFAVEKHKNKKQQKKDDNSNFDLNDGNIIKSKLFSTLLFIMKFFFFFKVYGLIYIVIYDGRYYVENT